MNKLICALLFASACAAPMVEPQEWPALPECRMPYAGAMAMPQEELEVGTDPALHMWRCYSDQGEGRSAIYRADRFELVVDGVAYRATTAQIEYVNTHHNWEDSLVATTPQAILRWRTSTDFSAVRHWLSATDRNGAVILAETELVQ